MIVSAELASSAVSFFDRAFESHAPRLASATLTKVGLSRDQVRRAIAKDEPLTPEQVRRAAVRAIGKQRVGRGGLPAYAVAAMHADYVQLKSIAKVAKLYGRTRQSMWQILNGHGRALQPRPARNPSIEYRGRIYTFSNSDRHCYYRETTRDRKALQRQVWEDHNGPIPAGMEITFADTNPRNCAIENLLCVPRTTASRRDLLNNRDEPRSPEQPLSPER